MANITKRGNSYRITVSAGYNISGKQIRHTMTWTPDPGMTKRQIEKELQRQAVLFEERISCSLTHDGNTRLVDFTEIFMRDYAIPMLKPKTAFNYKNTMAQVNIALGHIKLKDLKPGHIASFLSNLQEEGIRRAVAAKPKFDLYQWVAQKKITLVALSRSSGIAAGTLRNLKDGGTISEQSARKLAGAMGVDYNQYFETIHDMRPLSASTIRTYHRVLSSVLFRAVKWGYIPSNPATRADLPSTAGLRAAYLDEPDAKRLLELIKWRALITFDLLSGLRRAELLGLRWQDVDFDHFTITIAQTSNYLPGKGIYTGTPKTATSSRPVRLSRSAFLLLLEYKKWQDAQQAMLGDAWRDQDGRIFTTDEGAPIHPDSVSKWFTAFVKRTGLPKVTVHSLRHTYASLQISDGVPIVIVSHQLGHAQTSTTANIYAHVIAAAEARAAQSFDKFDAFIPEAKESAGA